MKRIAQIIQLKPEMEHRYRELHAACWPDILKILHNANIRNYSIYLRDGLLFAYYEYIGSDITKDMTEAAKDPIMERWLEVTMPCQQPVESAGADTWWADLEEVFHMD